MFIQSRTPDKIKGLYLWYDFSDRSTFNGGTISDGDVITLVRNKAWSNVNNNYGSLIADSTNLCTEYTYRTHDTDEYITLVAGDKPTWTEYGVNGLGSVYFGGHTSSKGYSDVLTTGFTWLYDIETWGGTGSTGPENYIGPIHDKERSIFIVYVTATTSGYNDNINAVDMYGTSVMGTQLPESGNFGCIFDIHAPVYHWIENSGLLPTDLGYYDTVTPWSDQVSYLNLIKYQDDSEWSIVNFLPDQGFSMSYGYPANDYSGAYKITNNTSYTSLFQFRSIDDNRGSVAPDPVPVMNITSTHVSVSNMDIDYYRNLKGVVCLESQDAITPPDNLTGIWYGHFSLGNSSRFWNGVPTDTGMVAGTNIPAVDPTYQSGFNGYIGEVVYYNHRLTDLETRHVREYLRKKWNIGQIGLPSGVGFDVIGTTLVVY